MLPSKVQEYIQNRISKGDVEATILYGSYARGTQHEKSDVDLIFVVKSGFLSTCVTHHGYVLEILETTKANMKSHWVTNMEQDHHRHIWKDAIVISQTDGVGDKIKSHANNLLETKTPLAPASIETRKRAMLARLEKAEFIGTVDLSSSAVQLYYVVNEIIEDWYKVRGLWRPPAKEYVSDIRATNTNLSSLTADFYTTAFNRPC